jgi:hypothetical protein
MPSSPRIKHAPVALAESQFDLPIRTYNSLHHDVDRFSFEYNKGTPFSAAKYMIHLIYTDGLDV